MDFYYRYGPVDTTTPWNRPTWDAIYDWWEEFKTTEGVEDYDFHIIGGVLYDMDNTWDVDISVTGVVKDFKVLGDLLKHARSLGHNKYKLFVDMFWYSSIDFCYEEISEENIKYYVKGTLGGDEVKVRDGEVLLHKEIGSGLIPVIGDGNEDLIFFFVQQPSDKHLSKPKGYNNKPPILLK